MIRYVLLLISLLLTPSIAFATPTQIWAGVWQGKVGTLPVRVCLNGEVNAGFGAYYYLRHLKPIALRQVESSKIWTEGDGGLDDATAARWAFETISTNRLTATWRTKGKSLPVNLTRVEKASDIEAPCGSRTFHAPRNAGGRIVAIPARLGNRTYTKLTFAPGPQFSAVAIESLALNEKSLAIARVNALLREKLPSAAGYPEFLGCLAGSLGSQGTEGYYSLSLTPGLITPNWLAVTVNAGSFCGGAHPSYSEYSRTFDLRTGKEIDLHSWFAPIGFAAAKDGVGPITPALRTLLLKYASKPEAECATVLATTDYWNIGLARGGMSFIPSLPHVAFACTETVVLPYAQLASFLNNQGVAGVRSVASELK